MTVSSVGTKMQDTTVRWHIYGLTHSMVALGMIGLCRFIPMVLFSMIGGAMADSKDRRRILLVTQTVFAASAIVLAILTVKGIISAASIYIVNIVIASALAFDSPARQSLIPNLLPRKHYSNAVSLNSTAYKFATVIGPYLAGSLIQQGSMGLIYGINAISFVAVLVALFFIQPQEITLVKTGTTAMNLSGLREGLKFVWSQPIQLWTICLDFFASFFSSAEALLPVFAKDILRVDARGYGLLTAASAVGSVFAGSFMAFRRTIIRQGVTMLAAVALYGCATIVFGASHLFWLSMAALAVAGAADTVSSIIRQTIRQLGSPDHLRGRMTSINMIFFTGGPQLGNLEAGLVANLVGAPLSVITGGIGCLAVVAFIGTRTTVLRNYRNVVTEG